MTSGTYEASFPAAPSHVVSLVSNSLVEFTLQVLPQYNTQISSLSFDFQFSQNKHKFTLDLT